MILLRFFPLLVRIGDDVGNPGHQVCPVFDEIALRGEILSFFVELCSDQFY